MCEKKDQHRPLQKNHALERLKIQIFMFCASGNGMRFVLFVLSFKMPQIPVFSEKNAKNIANSNDLGQRVPTKLQIPMLVKIHLLKKKRSLHVWYFSPLRSRHGTRCKNSAQKACFRKLSLYPTLMAYTGCALDFLITKRVFGGAGL